MREKFLGMSLLTMPAAARKMRLKEITATARVVQQKFLVHY